MKANLKNIVVVIVLIVTAFGCHIKRNQKENGTAILSDSLRIYFAKATDNSLSNKERFDYNQKALTLVLKSEQDSLFFKNLFQVADTYQELKVPEDYKITAELIATKAQETKNDTGLAKAYEYIGDYYKRQNLADSAYLYYHKAEKLYTLANDKEHTGKMMFNRASLQYHDGDFVRSESLCFTSLGYLLDIENKIKNQRNIHNVYNLLGMLANDQKHYDNALTYYNKALQLITHDSTIASGALLKANSLNNIGVAYRNKEDNKQALTYFVQALETKELHEKVPFLYAMLLDNIAYSRLKLKDDTDVPDFFYKALCIRDSLQLISGIVINKLHLSEYYQAQKQPKKAMILAEEAYTLAKAKDGDRRNLVHTLKQMQLVNPNLERAYALEYIQLSDSIQKAEPLLHHTITKLVEQNETLSLDKEALEKKNKATLFWSGITGLIALLVFINYATKLQLTKVNETIYSLILDQEQKIREASEEVQKRMTQKLYDHILNGIFRSRLFFDTVLKYGENKFIPKIPNLEKYVCQLKKTEDELREICDNLTRIENNNIYTSSFVNSIQEFLNRERQYFRNITEHTDPAIRWDMLKNNEVIEMYRTVEKSFKRIKKNKNIVDVDIAIYRENNRVSMDITGKKA